jgi:hypothetical protein
VIVARDFDHFQIRRGELVWVKENGLPCLPEDDEMEEQSG